MIEHITEATQAAAQTGATPPLFLINGSGFGIAALIGFLMLSAWVALAGDRG